MSKSAELTLEEGILLYKMLTKKFTKEELEGKDIPNNKQVVTQEEFNKFFEEEILSKIDQSKTIFPNKNSFSHIRLFDSNGDWLFDYDTNKENQYFYYSCSRVSTVFTKKFSLQDVDRHRLMKSLVGSHFNLHECQPQSKNGLYLWKLGHTSIYMSANRTTFNR